MDHEVAKERKILLIGKAKDVRKGLLEGRKLHLLYGKKVLAITNDLDSSLPSSFVGLLQEYSDVFPEEVLSGLPRIRGIEHQIDLILGAPLPNRPAYRSNPEKTKEIQRQVEELLGKGWMQESLSPCVVSVILVPNKDGSWRMCTDYKAINTITVKYRHSISKFDDMLDEIMGRLYLQKLTLSLDIIKLGSRKLRVENCV